MPGRFAAGFGCHPTGDPAMAKGLQQKKETKKKPTKTLKEKRAEKAAKKGG
jgi:hypothetical protein